MMSAARATWRHSTARPCGLPSKPPATATRWSPETSATRGAFDPAEPVASGAVVRAQYEEQLVWAAEEGVDFVIAETNDYLGEALIGLEVCQELGLPAMVTLASVQEATTYDGFGYVEACRILADRGATVVGLNCSRGPETMLPLLEEIRSAVDVAVAAQPVPYRTTAASRPSRRYPRGRCARFPIALEPSSARASRWRTSRCAHATSAWTTSASAAAAGPHHVRAMAEALGRQRLRAATRRTWSATRCWGRPATR